MFILRLRVGKHDSQGLFNVKRTYVLMKTRKIVFLDEHESHELHELIDKHRILLFERTRISLITRINR